MTAPKDRPKTPPRNVEDVDYVNSDAPSRPMREVLRERKKSAARITKKLLVEAFRHRAGLIGQLQSCLCAYPLVESDTESKHEEWCPAHLVFLSSKAVRESNNR